MKERAKKSKTKRLAVFFILTGLLLVATSGVIAFYNYNEDEKAGEASREIVSQLRQELDVKEEVVEQKPVYPDLSMTIKNIDGFDYVGYITIPTLELELPVMSSWDYNKLKYAPCRYYGWAGDSNMVIAAHNYRNHFASLTRLTHGDKVSFSDMNGNVYEYEVGDIELLEPNDVEIMKNSDWDLSLYTCNYGASARVTVRCRQTNKFPNQLAPQVQ